MSMNLVLEMAVADHPDRVAIVSDELRLTVADLASLAGGGAGVIADSGARHVVYIGTGGADLAVSMLASGRAAVPYTPLNYRLSTQGLHELIGRLDQPLVIADLDYLDVAASAGTAIPPIESGEFLARAHDTDPVDEFADPDAPAVVLFTSGTTSRPKAVQLSGANLASYIMQTVEFASMTADDASLVCVPPYHIAGVSAVLSNLYAGRRIVYLRNFDPTEWVRLIEQEHVTSATVVPTMLARIVAELERTGATLPSLTSLAYGGSKVALPLVRRAIELLPHVGFVNAYGLTETSSTIAVLTPDDHRAALDTDDPAIARRLGSVGQSVPGIEIAIRAADGTDLPAGYPGELYVRGDQVSGRYDELGSVLDDDGWFATKDLAERDEDGYIFISGRMDDTIIRGGENIAPAEIESVLVEHPDVADVAVVGVEDPQWGQIIVAVVVPAPDTTAEPDELRAFVRDALRGSRTPDRIVLADELPTTATGKVLRRSIVDDLRTNPAVSSDSTPARTP
ncbi:class I adenylate-forming enzyme family protein [Gordonia hydrophobica]|uniref:Fatty acid--CoA ligase family protein n=1 Tax=Gordonia hydrophobica TaxID=40516 RepID=A0ABZ2TZU3_9ACTN|nr:fatty acid--CoA ligase family protein [Gordonia hydrophobica]MBM7369233.1 acyl-CoA synthetase (AMP-forming)/AMP-acid ligase II [Gordonia hydrophobica]